jgi:hypothetical protein
MAGKASPSIRRPTTLHAIRRRSQFNAAKVREEKENRMLPLLHWLTGGVWTLQAAGRPSARDRSMVTPPREDEASLHHGLELRAARRAGRRRAVAADVAHARGQAHQRRRAVVAAAAAGLRGRRRHQQRDRGRGQEPERRRCPRSRRHFKLLGFA